ncbi:NADH-quinone oxidoreductase subunit N [Candidatus Halobeggiatoa sp. HSG11]|nr:NADH-quinone oxidoreductase subunit N [Candidatus Halobeggiatoa sp. HSG11]
MTIANLNIAWLLPEILILTMACVILVIDAYLPKQLRNLTYHLTQGTLLGAALLIIAANPMQPILAMNDMVIIDAMSVVLKLFIVLIVFFTFIYSREYLQDRKIFKGEYFVLGLFATLGMLIMVSAHNLLMVFLGLELLSLSLYAMIAMNRDSKVATEAAMKYFVLGALASGMLLYGMSMLYGITATLDLTKLSQSVSEISNDRIVISSVNQLISETEEVELAIKNVEKHVTTITNSPIATKIAEIIEANIETDAMVIIKPMLASSSQNYTILVFGLVFIVIGVAFKLGAVPFHSWIPDVYHGSPTSMTLFVASAPKIAAFAMVIRMLVDGMQTLHTDWQGMLILLSILSIIVGNIIAIAQQNIKRMLAYSTIAHVGYLLLGIIAANADGYAASMFYVVVYTIMTLGAFGMIILLSRTGFEADKIEDFKGLNERNPWYAMIMLIIMLSMAGVPPMVGFWAKWAVLAQVINAGFVWLAVLAVLFAVIGAFYYLRIVKLMYFDKPTSLVPIEAGVDMRFALSANALIVLLLGLMPNTLMAICLGAWGISV